MSPQKLCHTFFCALMLFASSGHAHDRHSDSKEEDFVPATPSIMSHAPVVETSSSRNQMLRVTDLELETASSSTASSITAADLSPAEHSTASSQPRSSRNSLGALLEAPLIYISLFLPPKDKARLRCVNRRFSSVLYKPAMASIGYYNGRISAMPDPAMVKELKVWPDRNLSFIRRFTNLRSLNVGIRRLGSDHVAEIMDHINKVSSLENLVLVFNEANHEAALYLASILPQLARLKRIRLGIESLDTAPLFSLMPPVLSLPNLKALNISKSLLLPVDSDTIMSMVARALPSLPSLESLTLSRNGLAENGIIELVDALKYLPNLKELDLSGTPIGSRGAEHIANHLPLFRDLMFLDLSECCLGDKGATYIANVLPEVSRLQFLSLAENHIQEKGFRTLIQMLPKLQRLESLDLSEPLLEKPTTAGSLAWILSSFPSLKNLGFRTRNLIDHPTIEHLRRTCELLRIRVELQSFHEGRFRPLSPY